MDRNDYNEDLHACGNCAHSVCGEDFDEEEGAFECWFCTYGADPMPEPIDLDKPRDQLTDEEHTDVMENEDEWEEWEDENFVMAWGTCSRWKKISAPEAPIDITGLN